MANESQFHVTPLNKTLTNDHISKPYPHITVEPSNSIALVLPTLPAGDLPVLCYFEGTCRQLGSIKRSALVLKTLIAVSKVEYVDVTKKVKVLSNISEILEIL